MRYPKKTYHLCVTLFVAFVMVVSFVNCSSDESANADIAQLTVEMCLAKTGEAKQVVSATTDSDVKLSFTRSLSTSWAQKGDSVYRALIYYNKVSDSSTSANAEPLRADIVHVLKPYTPEAAKKWSDEVDPLDLTSSWFANNGKYLNLRLAIKTGSSDGDNNSQIIGLVCDTTIVSPGGKRQYYRLCHNQNNVPTYYTVDLYASIPADHLAKGDTMTITLPLWSGLVQKDFIK